MEILYPFFYFMTFIFGTVMGSFLNVVSIDIEAKVLENKKISWKKILSKRSICPKCSFVLQAINLVPLISFLAQKTRCISCKGKISWRYFWVEVFSGLLFVSIFHKLVQEYGILNLNSFLNLSYLYVIFSLLIIIFLFDLKHKIIPNIVVFPFIFLSFLYLFIDFQKLDFILPNLWSLSSGIIIALPFYFLWLLSRGKWMGFGDFKLVLGIGYFLTAWTGSTLSSFSSIALSFWIGAIFGLILILLTKIQKRGLIFSNKNFTIKSEIPFGPFLLIGLWGIFYFNLDFFNLSLIL